MRYIDGVIFNKDGSRVSISVVRDIAEKERESLESDDRIAAVWFEGDGPGYDWDAESSSWQRRLF